MKIETLKRSHLKRNIIIGVVGVLIISAIILNFTRARYRSVATTSLIHSTINYSAADLNIVAITVNGEEVDTIPTGNYELTEESYCEVNGVRDDSVELNYDMESQMLTVTPITTKGTKCYLDFNKKQNAGEGILANYTNQLTRNDFSTTVTNTTTGTIYYADTSKGRTYYFAGNPTDNWVSFAGFYWRIIRINEDGSIRLIYNGTGTGTTGTSTQLQTSVFNYTYGDNTYVGYMMGLENQCSSGSCSGSKRTSSYSQSVSNSYDSTIKGVLDDWYEKNLQENYADKISTEAGFCGDRTYVSGDAYGTSVTDYGAYNRLVTNKTPSFECTNTADLYTVSSANSGNKALDYPIGLITADEVAYAGGVYGQTNNGYYLYTNQYYWTMSPHRVNSSGFASMFNVSSSGNFGIGYVTSARGVRPVINLSPNVTITGEGTSSNPYVVS